MTFVWSSKNNYKKETKQKDNRKAFCVTPKRKKKYSNNGNCFALHPNAIEN